MTIRTIKGRIVLAIVLVGCIPLVIGLVLASMSGMRSLRDVIGGNFQAIAEQAADRLTMLVQSQVQGTPPCLRALAGAPAGGSRESLLSGRMDRDTAPHPGAGAGMGKGS